MAVGLARNGQNSVWDGNITEKNLDSVKRYGMQVEILQDSPPSALLINNWHIRLCEFTVYNMLI